MADQKLRVLMLHGYMQNAEVFRSKTGSLRKALKSKVGDFVIPDAPLTLEEVDDEESRALGGGDEGAKRAWFTTTDVDDTGKSLRPSQSRQYTPWADLRAYLAGVVESDGPFDLVFGFSQGACVAGLLCAEFPKAVRAAVLVGGFLPRDDDYLGVLGGGGEGEGAGGIDVVSMHVMGEGDKFVPNERSRGLEARFAGAEEVVHEGGHFIPSDKGFRETMKAFCDRVLEAKHAGAA